MSVHVSTYRFTVDEFHRMGEAGIFKEDDRVELLDGEIIELTPIGSRHAACVDKLTRILTEKLGRTAIVRVQNPIILGDRSEPQPDLSLLNPRPDFYAGAHPCADDVLFGIEVSDATLLFDREVKLPIYGKAGIREIWIVNLPDHDIEVYRRPSSQGYQFRQDFSSSEQISPAAYPNLSILVQDILP